jgi:glucose-1-phosphate adenylyltransferase
MMKTRAIILAGGEGTRLGVLTAKRTKPAVPFGGKYRIIDFALSNCVNSNIFDVMIVAQYRPHSLIEHIGAGGPWDLDRDFTGGVRIFTPYKARKSSWFVGTADAVQQNFRFIKTGDPDLVLILSGDHIYTMDYSAMIRAHMEKGADMSMATIAVTYEEASRFGIVDADTSGRITAFVEKPAKPPSTLANMGVYLFNCEFLDRILWEDSQKTDSSHDFGKDIIPNLVNSGAKVYAFPYKGYWVDVGTVNSYWQAHMDLLSSPPQLDLYDRSWVIHTRTEERPPARISKGAIIDDCLISNGCIIEEGVHLSRSILSSGVIVRAGATVGESILLTDCELKEKVSVVRSVIDKRVKIGAGCVIGEADSSTGLKIAMIGKSAVIPPGSVIHAGGMVGTDVVPSDFQRLDVKTGEYLQTQREPHEI